MRNVALKKQAEPCEPKCSQFSMMTRCKCFSRDNSNVCNKLTFCGKWNWFVIYFLFESIQRGKKPSYFRNMKGGFCPNWKKLFLLWEIFIEKAWWYRQQFVGILFDKCIDQFNYQYHLKLFVLRWVGVLRSGIFLLNFCQQNPCIASICLTCVEFKDLFQLTSHLVFFQRKANTTVCRHKHFHISWLPGR